MRVKTEAKRQEILTAALDLFMEQGFERTLMSQVSDRAGCSKGTLYSYFRSKEDLYFAAVDCATSPEAGSVLDVLDATQPIEGQLRSFGIGLLRTVYSPRFQAVRRLVFSTPSRHGLGPVVYEKAVRPYMVKTTEFLALAMSAGKLRSEDPAVAAYHLCGLLESELLLKFLLHALEDVSGPTLEAIAQRAVATFVAAYEIPPRKAKARHQALE
ncbi:DNA-binding transcriptional regulator, AcrR family [Ralstonia sp. 25mfcol4.1]|uniref:TetR/AcrR family transcriptional regulator n=1 Tax=Ralstonia sp. 25mfcol4.1 TaxID=1761899 RepID=UPI000889594E|nr:TetR/AcrR family transcriptional regulator [Ralstonia sp. 25mfcol4.1]SDP81794.1 DNA-binding transcriptional regulator, AcrR family [Ralstonia sp. 25mfcol4.1]